jgi:hypothetical protein
MAGGFMRYLVMGLLLLLAACSHWDELAEQQVPVTRIVAAYTHEDFSLCLRLMNKQDSFALNKMLSEGRCRLIAARAFEPTIIPTEEQNYIYGILYPEEVYVFVNKSAYLAAPDRVLGK